MELGEPPAAPPKRKRRRKAAAEEEPPPDAVPTDEAGLVAPLSLSVLLECCAAEEAGAALPPSYALRAQWLGCALRLLRQVVRVFHGCDSVRPPSSGSFFSARRSHDSR